MDRNHHNMPSLEYKIMDCGSVYAIMIYNEVFVAELLTWAIFVDFVLLHLSHHITADCSTGLMNVEKITKNKSEFSGNNFCKSRTYHAISVDKRIDYVTL